MQEITAFRWKKSVTADDNGIWSPAFKDVTKTYCVWLWRKGMDFSGHQ